MTHRDQILVLNAGSSSIKYQLFEMRGQRSVAEGLLQRLASPNSQMSQSWIDASGQPQQYESHQSIADHAAGLQLISQTLQQTHLISADQPLLGVGHRVVHGGAAFQHPTLINEQVLDGIRANIPLAPLHNPANLLGIEVTMAQMPDIPQVAVFDTAFHHSLPPHAYRYALPDALYHQLGVRRYGFHGTSHAYVARQAAAYLDRPLSQLSLISLHLGNGASAAAIQHGRSMDTSMGMTPLAGLVMGTRSGDLDPGILFYLTRQGYSPEQLETLLNHDSGLQGLCGDSDMRAILTRASQGDTQAELAVEMFCYRIKKTIGAYAAAMGSLDALIFTGGIGENASEIRQRACQGLQILGIEIDPQANARSDTGITTLQTIGSTTKVLVIATNEELEIALQTKGIIDTK